jgi:hypothetical protein
MRYAVCVESDITGWSTAHAVGLPGCYATAGDPRLALDALFTAIPDYWTWLRGHGVAAPGPDDLGEVTLGVVEFARDGLPGGGTLFEYETAAPTRAMIESTLDRLAYSRADLLALVADLPPARLAAGRSDGVGGILAHLAATEHEYMRVLGPHAPVPTGGGPLGRLRQVRAAVVAQILALPEGDYGRIFVHRDERWNIRKLLRRLIEHEREHTVEVARLLEPTCG